MKTQLKQSEFKHFIRNKTDLYQQLNDMNSLNKYICFI